MRKEVLKIGDAEIEKRKFYFFKNSIHVKYLNIINLIICKKFSLRIKFYKYFIGSKFDKKSYVILYNVSEKSGHTESFDKSKYISFLLKDEIY